MLVSLVVAMDETRTIGRDGGLPWHLPADLRNFKKITMGKPIVMGRKTHESIGRSLPGRENIVVTRNRGYRSPGCTVVHSLNEALEAGAGVDEIMIIGGATIYLRAIPVARRIYLTQVHTRISGDVQFPELEADQWRATERVDHLADERNPHAYSFVVLEKQDR